MKKTGPLLLAHRLDGIGCGAQQRGGISGGAQIINHFTNWPIGLMVFIGNAPLFLLGWRYLGGARFALRTAVAVAAFSLLTDLLVWFIPAEGITDDLVLNCLFGGILLGVGLGLVYRGQGTSGGSDILGRILNSKLGISISQAYLITDTVVVLAGGFAFDWRHALYGLVVIYVSGLAAEAVSEGSRIVRTAMPGVVPTAPSPPAGTCGCTGSRTPDTDAPFPTRRTPAR